jgi:hypothetical protein
MSNYIFQKTTMKIVDKIMAAVAASPEMREAAAVTTGEVD